MTKTTTQRVNYHTHCDRCRHARGKAEEYVEQALKAGVRSLGFSDHMPFYDDRFGLRMPWAELDEYLQEITALRDTYKDRMSIPRGFEGEYVREDNAYYEKLLSRGDCDYLLLGHAHGRLSLRSPSRFDLSERLPLGPSLREGLRHHCGERGQIRLRPGVQCQWLPQGKEAVHRR